MDLKRKLISAFVVFLVGMFLVGCGANSDVPLTPEDNSALFENNKNDQNAYGDHAGLKLKDYFKQTGENYISVSGDIVRTKDHKIRIDRTDGNDMYECEVVAVEEIERYKQYEGITYKEYVHLTDDREIVRVTKLGNKEKGAYVETGNGIILYFEEGVSGGVKAGGDTEELFDLFITECTN